MHRKNIDRIVTILALTSLLFSAAIFGFFYAWVCSTMWGLDNADPRIAIGAMQAMNASVRNAVFAPAFFGTPLVLLVTAGVMATSNYRLSAVFFALSSVVYFCFGMVLTIGVNVPMNQALSLIVVPNDIVKAGAIWGDYSAKWQFWNQTRTLASAASFLLAAYGTIRIGHTAN